MNIINYFTSIYHNENYYLRKKAEYSIVLVFISIFAMITIMTLESLIVGSTPLKLTLSALFVAVFLLILFIIKWGYYEFATNLLIIGSMLRCLQIYNYPTPFQFYVMGILSLITMSVIYIKKYQIIALNLIILILYFYKIPVNYQLVQTDQLHFRAYSQSVYSTILLLAVIVMLTFLKQIIDREINESEKLLNHATKDNLTQLYNRHRITELYYANKSNHLGVIILDIDFFKHINDSYGHHTGDIVLKNVAKLILNESGNGHVSRWGGEEFLILLPQTTKSKAYTIAEHIRLSVENHTFIDDIQITVSLGLTMNVEKDSITSVVRRADNGLYKSKSSGRNKTTYI